MEIHTERRALSFHLHDDNCRWSWRRRQFPQRNPSQLLCKIPTLESGHLANAATDKGYRRPSSRRHLLPRWTILAGTRTGMARIEIPPSSRRRQRQWTPVPTRFENPRTLALHWSYLRGQRRDNELRPNNIPNRPENIARRANLLVPE